MNRHRNEQTNLNKFHADVAEETLRSNGYGKEEGDEELIKRVRDLLLKRTLGRPPFEEPLKGPFPLSLLSLFGGTTD